jgi:dTDP-4-dehydrorhamnose reductase
MRVLVLGADGQVGRSLTAVAPADAEVLALGRASCDLTDRSAIESMIYRVAPDLIFNAAAYTAVDAAEDNPELAALVNRDAVCWIAQAASARGSRLVHISTDFVFDGLSSRPYPVEHPVHPLSAYGRSKSEGETQALQDGSNLVVRTSWVYAAQGTNFVLTMLRLMKERGSVRVVADQIGSPTYAPSLATSLWDLARQDSRGIFHVTDAGVASWYDFAVAIAEEGRAAGLLSGPVSVSPISSADFPMKAVRPSFSVLDKSRTVEVLGRELPHWRSNLRLMIKEVQALG